MRSGSESNFNRNFMKMKGMTPTEYRALARVELAKKEATPDDQHGSATGLRHRI